MANPVFACVAPHPPIIVPEVGQGRERATKATLDAFAELRERLAEARPDVLLLICPHGPIAGVQFHVLTGRLQGDLSRFGAAGVRFDYATDRQFVEALLEEASRRGVALTAIEQWERHDHSAWVPLRHLRAAAPDASVVALSISAASPQDHFALGEAVAAVIAAQTKRVAIIASADGAHALKADGPYGYHPAAPRWEAEFQEALAAWDVERVLGFDDEFRRLAAEDSIPSVAFLMGALSQHTVQPRILASEGPWGVGYMTALVEVGAPIDEATEPPVSDDAAAETIVRIARTAVESYVRDGQRPPMTKALEAAASPPWYKRKAATFVSIFAQDGGLRGCVGTVEPAEANVAAEVVSNAVAAATRDPRFAPVAANELSGLAYKVDVLSEPEWVPDAALLDAREFGVIVESEERRGVLLPDLEGVDTVEEQLSVARRKAGIGPDEQIVLYRFRVERYAE